MYDAVYFDEFASEFWGNLSSTFYGMILAFWVKLCLGVLRVNKWFVIGTFYP